MENLRPLPNSPGARGWVWAGNYRLERYLYLMHRITGLGILFFFVIHLVITTVFRIQGQNVWEAAMRLLHNPVLKFGEYLVVLAFIIHGLNGIRLTLQELGFALGRPAPPIYPYRDALSKKRPLINILIIIAAVLAIIFLFSFVKGGW